MFATIFTSLLPIAFILILGYFAGFRKDFAKDQAAILNKMVMLYALPLYLFSSIVTTSVSEILAQKDLLLGLFTSMIGFFFVVYLLARYVFKQSIKFSALISIAISGPAIPFVGLPVLSSLYGTLGTIPVGVGSIYLNLFLVPFTVILMNQDNSNSSSKSTFITNIVTALKEPVVWAPILGVCFVLMEIKLPIALIDSFALLGKASGGVGLFTSGLILYSYTVTFTKTVWVLIFSKNILVPFGAWGIALLFNFSPSTVKEIVITMSIPTASISMMLAIQYDVEQRIISSTLFLGSILSILTMGLFIFLLS